MWLALREEMDAAARSSDVTAAVVRALPHDRPVRAVDLGTGTGSNIRYLAPRLPSPQRWLAVDREPLLLTMVPSGVETFQRELDELHADLFAGRVLVTASALLDLVSVSWIEHLAAHCRSAGAAVLFALTYDGRSACSPHDEDDEAILELFNRHQRANDKGFGRAAGPDGAAAAVRAFRAAGYDVQQARSDWLLPPESPEVQRLLVAGWAEAALEVAPDRAAMIDAWLRRRLAHVDAATSRIVVGHVDVGGWPIR